MVRSGQLVRVNEHIRLSDADTRMATEHGTLWITRRDRGDGLWECTALTTSAEHLWWTYEFTVAGKE